MRRRPSGHSPGLLGVQALVLALAGAWELGAQQDRAAQTPEPPAFTLSAEEDIEGPLPDTPLTPAEVGSAAPWVHGLL